MRRGMNPKRTLARKAYRINILKSSAPSALDYSEWLGGLSPLSSGLFHYLGCKGKHKYSSCRNQACGCQP